MNKKTLLVSTLIILFGGFFIYEKFGATQTSPTPIINNNQPQVLGNNNPPAPVTTTITSGFKDGTYVGDETTSMYGKAKAQVTISGGKITDVAFLEYPSDRAASLRKSQMAMPVIKQEVIQSQSANVNTVSGATQTSASFIQSISSAITQAS